MKHETINSIVGVIGLLIASVTAFNQFLPEKEKLQVVVESKIDTGRPVEFSGFGLLRPSDSEISPLLGPFSWKLRLFNNTDRVISVVGYRLFQSTVSGTRISSNSFNEQLSQLKASLSKQNFPLHIKAFETNAYILSFMIPIKQDTDEADSCFKNSSNIRQIEKCLFTKGRDLFGNSIKVTFDKSNPDNYFSVSWSSKLYSPSFIIEFTTAKGNTFSSELSYYPFR